MTAGSGAQERADHAARRVEVVRRQLEAAEKQERAWAAGAEGERRVAAALDALVTDGWRALHDVHWPGRPRANLDHVLVGPGGIVVVDAKNWSGDVQVRGGVVRVRGYARRKEVVAALEAAAAVAALLEPQHRMLVHSALCFVQHDLEPVDAGGVTVVGLGHIVAWCRTMRVVLTADEVEGIAGHLRCTLSTATIPAQLTTGHAERTDSGGRGPRLGARRATTRRHSAQQKRARAKEERRRRDRRAALVKLAVILVFALTTTFWIPALIEVLQSVSTSVLTSVFTPSGSELDPGGTGAGTG